MSFFDQAYDEMSWQEVCYRLPSDLAVSALKRRINNLDTMLTFFELAQSQPAHVKDLKDHINNVVMEYDVDEVFDTFEAKMHPVLFNWMNENNLKRLKDDGQDKMTYKFLFNLATPDDVESLTKVLDIVLEKDHAVQSEVLSILNKVSNKHFHQLLSAVLGDPRPEVRVCALSVSDPHNQRLVSELHQTIALKALAKSTAHDRYMNPLNFKLFSNLRPKERLISLDRYFRAFPKYKQLQIFDPMPTEDEFNLVLFAGCIEHNDTVKKLHDAYKDITSSEKPIEAEDEKEDV